MVAAMSDANHTRSPEHQPAERSTRAVFGILGALLGVAVAALVIVALATSGLPGGGGGSSDLVAGIDDERFQAVYMTDDRIFFGKLREGDGDWVVVEDAYYPRRADSGAAAKGEEATAQTEIVPVSREVGGTGDLRINTSEIKLVQDLAARSEISTTIEDATK